MNNELAIASTPTELVRTATDIAGLCKGFVVSTAVSINGKKFVKVEGWQSIAAAHGCVPEIESVEEKEVEGVYGIMAHAVLRRMSDGILFGRATGFVGSDETGKGNDGWATRNKYARIAMAQTRAISRACRNAFAYVVVMMAAGLETTPAEEVPPGGFDDGQKFAKADQLPKPPPGSKRAKPETTPSSVAEDPFMNNVQVFEGRFKDYSFKNSYHAGFIDGHRLWSQETSMGRAMGLFNDTDVTATCQVMKKKDGNGHSYKLVGIQQATLNDDLNMDEADTDEPTVGQENPSLGYQPGAEG